MVMSSNGEGSSIDVRQISDSRSTSTPHSGRSKGKDAILETGPEGYRGAVLESSSEIEVPRGYAHLTALIKSHTEFVISQQFRELTVKNVLDCQAELLKLRKQLQEIDTSSVKSFKTETQRERLLLMGKLQEVVEYNSALCRYAAINATPSPNTANIASLRAWIQNEGSPSNVSTDEVLDDVYDLIALQSLDRSRSGTRIGCSTMEPRDGDWEAADLINGSTSPGQLEKGDRLGRISPRISIWCGHVKNEMKKLSAAAFIVIGISLYSLNISAALGYLILANLPGSEKPSLDNYLKVCVITWASTLKILVVYESFYGNYRKENGPMKYLLSLVSLSTGLCFAVTFAMHVLGANVISGVLIALSLSVVFIRIWAD